MTQRHARPRPSDNDRKLQLDYLEAQGGLADATIHSKIHPARKTAAGP
jgi:hypothetical protein